MGRGRMIEPLGLEVDKYFVCYLAESAVENRAVGYDLGSFHCER